MKKIIVLLTILLVGCATSKIQYVPVQGENIIEYKDTTIYLCDTIYVPLPAEKAETTNTNFEPSHLETSIATSDAWVEDNKLHHTLKNKPVQLKTKIDTLVKIEYVNKYIEKPVIQEVEVKVPYIPKWTIWLMVFGGICAVWNIAKIILKIKSGGLL